MYNGYYNTVFYGNSSANATGNQLIGCNLEDCYYFGSYNIYQSGLQITGNTIERPTRSTLNTFYGIYVSTGCIGSLVNNNRIRNPFFTDPTNTNSAYCIYLSNSSTSGNEHVVENNLISDIVSNGTIYGIYTSNSNYLKLYHNTISLDDQTASVTSTSSYGIYNAGNTGVDIRDNNISITRANAGTKYGLFLSGSGKVCNYNNLYVNTLSGNNYVGYNGSGYTTLAAWISANGSNYYDTASVAVPPIFANPGNGDYTPTNASLENKGTYVGVLTDIVGTARSTSMPDIGCYEFTVPSCTGSPTAGTASGPSTICPGQNFMLNLTGYSIGVGISLQWQYYDPVLSTWTNVSTGGTNPSYTTNITSPTDFRCQITCANGGASDISNTVSVGVNNWWQCYCTPGGTNSNYYIDNFSTAGGVQNITNMSTGFSTGGYGDYTSVDTLIISAGNTFIINANYGSGSNFFGTKVWIDFDGDGNFTTPGDQVYVSSNYANSLTTSISIPSSATPITTRMRIGISNTPASGPADPCTPVSGEFEDYEITILPPPSCLFPIGITATNITSTTADISWNPVTGAVGYEYILDQNSGNPTGSGIATTATTYNASSLSFPGTYYFHVRTSCGSGNFSTWSTIVFNTVLPNDYCSGAIAVPYTGTITGDNTMATDDILPSVSCGSSNNGIYKGLWYKVTPSSSGTMTISLCTGTSWDTYLRVYEGTCGNLNICDGYNDDYCNSQSQLDVTAVANTTYYILVTGYGSNAYGSFTLTISGVPLAIKLADISATNVGSKNRVDWVSASEDKGDYYVVQRSADGRNYQDLSIVKGNAKASTYSYWDEAPYGGINYYRLKIMDIAGNASYSKVVTAIMKGDRAFTIDAYPNPVSDLLTVKLYGNAGSNAMVTITDVTGKVVKVVTIGNNTATISMSELAAGMYLVKYTDNIHSQILKVNKK